MRLHFCELAPHARNLRLQSRFALSEPGSVFHMVYRALRSGAISVSPRIEMLDWRLREMPLLRSLMIDERALCTGTCYPYRYMYLFYLGAHVEM